MTVAGWIEILLFIAVLTALTPVLGGYQEPGSAGPEALRWYAAAPAAGARAA